ncbi:MAG TPA: hypothetical protein PLA71_00655 [Saccharofermentans sp.]|nr:hypothetical protein [Saccharofermentans sp.]
MKFEEKIQTILEYSISSKEQAAIDRLFPKDGYYSIESDNAIGGRRVQTLKKEGNLAGFVHSVSKKVEDKMVDIYRLLTFNRKFDNHYSNVDVKYLGDKLK